MRHIFSFLTIIVIILVVACSQEYTAEHMAKLYVKANYSDCREVVYCKVDTVTYGDNLNYRIDKFNGYLNDEERNYERWKTDRIWPKEQRMTYMENAKANIDKYKRILSALDSLRNNSGNLLNFATAYTVCIAYNQPTNLVWVQMDEHYELLKISKMMEDLYFNPGNDIPGYFEVITANESGVR